MLKLIAIASSTFLLSVSSAQGQALISADMAVLQPLIKRDGRGFVSCGVRAVVIKNLGNQFEAYDFSVNANADMPYGTLKAGKSIISSGQVAKGNTTGKIVLPAPEYFWLARGSSSEAVMPIKVMPSEDAGFVLEFADLVKTYESILAIVEGEPMQFAVRYKKQKLDYVIAFSAHMPEQERNPLKACMNSIAERLVADYGVDK